MSRNDAITTEESARLLRFLPVFAQPGRKYVAGWIGGETLPDGTLTFARPVYAAEVERFFALAGQSCWMDYAYDPAQAQALLYDDARLAAATLAEIKALLTYCVRGERFCDGFWARLLEEGRIVALLRRLRTLQTPNQGEHCG